MIGPTWRLDVGNALEVLAGYPDESVQCVVTSPPYYGLRDYNLPPTIWGDGWVGCLGLEPTVDMYLEHMAEVFAQVRRVLRRDGTVWLNIGDSYAAKPRGSDEGWATSRLSNPARVQKAQSASLRRGRRTRHGAKEKDLLMVPARLALTLRDEGWWLRSEIIWHKLTPMPESVGDRPTRSHEQLYLLTKAPRYYYDADAIREPHADSTIADQARARSRPNNSNQPDLHPGHPLPSNPLGRNKRTVWTLASRPFPDAHFATFPTDLVEPCILAGTSAHGACACGAPWRRLVEVEGRAPTSSEGRPLLASADAVPGASPDLRKHAGHHGNNVRVRHTRGWEPTCECTDPGPAARCVVLDPFAGAGTTLMVGLRLGRSAIGIELNPEYSDLARERVLADQPLHNTPAEAIA